MIVPTEDLQVFAAGLDHPEGVVVGVDGAVYAGGEAGQVYRIDPATGQAEVVAGTGGFCLGLSLDRARNIYVCDCKLGKVIRIESDGVCRDFAGPFVTPNFGVFDRGGNLYVSDSGDWGRENGCVYRISSEGTRELLPLEPLAFANGLALDAAEDFLYIVESTEHRVVRLDLKTMSGPEVYVDCLARVPDGLAFDALGRLYVTCYASDLVYRCDRSGEKEVLCADPDATLLNRPTNCAFLGESLLVANLGGDSLTRVLLDCLGAPLYHQNAIYDRSSIL